jgi:hypothetical protein
MSLLEAYKGIVSQVYKLTQLSYQHRDSSNEFDSFLDHLQDVLEHKQQSLLRQESIHIPPHVEIIHEPAENVVVVKDDSVKNITLRHIAPSEIQADEQLEMNELIHETPITEVDDGKDTMETILDEDTPDIAQDIADAEAEAEEAAAEEAAAEEAAAEEAAAETVNEEKEDEDEDEDNDLYVKTQKKVKYFVSAESKRVYQYIDDTTRGVQVGKLENGKIVLM